MAAGYPDVPSDGCHVLAADLTRRGHAEALALIPAEGRVRKPAAAGACSASPGRRLLREALRIRSAGGSEPLPAGTLPTQRRGRVTADFTAYVVRAGSGR